LSIPDPNADSSELSRLIAEWVEAVRPLIAITPNSQRKDLQKQLLAAMVEAGWSRQEAKAALEDLLPHKN
jgi:hypothetical protein